MTERPQVRSDATAFKPFGAGFDARRIRFWPESLIAHRRPRCEGFWAFPRGGVRDGLFLRKITTNAGAGGLLSDLGFGVGAVTSTLRSPQRGVLRRSIAEGELRLGNGRRNHRPSERNCVKIEVAVSPKVPG